ncbi:MAG TPA: (4Fe-4S)-binding protein [Thermoanaerobaculia bacterium]|nr:(4Fe-4S)-binding protein [Thermoanaerobaculia bacterium]
MPGTPSKTYRTNEIAVTFEPRLCIHSAVCLRALPAVFDVHARPWVAPDQASADEIAEAVRLCPSGALTYVRTEGPGETAEEPDPEPVIVALENGPFLLHGDFTIEAADGTPIRRVARATLCRCGASKNKPFCDNSHRTVGFRSAS